MNQALRPQPQLGEVLPGALTLGLFLLWVYDCFPDKLDLFWGSNTNAALLVILAGGFLFASWITGTILDSIRNLITEGIVDCCSEEKINWDFLFTGDKDKVFQLDEYYFAYYQAKSNYAIGLIIFLLYSTISACILHWNRLTAITCVIAIITFGICLFDARSLRNEIKRLVRVAPELLVDRLQHLFPATDFPMIASESPAQTKGYDQIRRSAIARRNPMSAPIH
jgi:hypothetical protein